MNPITKKTIKLFLIGLTIVVFLIITGFFFYLQNYYPANTDDRDSALLESGGQIIIDGNYTIFQPNQKSQIGFIFYPGGKVEHTAYRPLMEQLALQGITMVLVEMPFRLAVFDVNRADSVFDKLPNITNWYVGGHSLGGAMASSYAIKNETKITGIILLGAYPVGKTELPILALYGSQDFILNREKLDGLETTIEIYGGNHAYFGNYGEQKGDGEATISAVEQQQQTVEAIITFIS